MDGDPMFDLGMYLRESRQRAGFSLSELQSRTKIRMRYLEAIEEGDFGLIPGEVYLKGFLKLYAQAVGLDPSDILERYEECKLVLGIPKEEQAPVQSAPVMIPKGRRGSRWAALAAILFVLAIAYAVLAPPTGEQVPPVLPGGVPAEPDSSMVTGDDTPVPLQHAEETQPAEQTDSVPPVEPEGPISVDLPGDTSISGVPELAEEPVSVPVGEADTSLPNSAPPAVNEASRMPILLEVSVRERCWVEVFTDESKAASRTLESGENVFFEASDGIVIKFGNPAGVDLALNGIPLGPAGYGVVTRIFDTAFVERVVSEGPSVYRQIVASEIERIRARQEEQNQQQSWEPVSGSQVEAASESERGVVSSERVSSEIPSSESASSDNSSFDDSSWEVTDSETNSPEDSSSDDTPSGGISSEEAGQEVTSPSPDQSQTSSRVTALDKSKGSETNE